MNKSKLIAILFLLVLTPGAAVNQALAQEPGSQLNDAGASARSGEEMQLSKMLAQARPQRRPFFSLVPEIGHADLTGTRFSITSSSVPPQPVTGNGTLGKLTKWTGFTNSNSAIGDSNIYEDKFGRVGIGTDSPTSKLTVAGFIETSGAVAGVKFPDGTVQTTSASTALLTVVHDQTLSGKGTLASPLGVVQSEALLEPVAGTAGLDLFELSLSG